MNLAEVLYGLLKVPRLRRGGKEDFVCAKFYEKEAVGTALQAMAATLNRMQGIRFLRLAEPPSGATMHSYKDVHVRGQELVDPSDRSIFYTLEVSFKFK